MGQLCGGFLGLTLLLVALAGCATQQYSDSPARAVSTACEQQLLRWRTDVAVDDRFDAQDWSPPNFPYLRVDRFLASFDLTAFSPPQRRDWLERAHRKALTAWRYEMQGAPPQAAQWRGELQDCTGRAIDELASKPDLWQELARVVAVPDSYSTTARVLGLYPLVAPIVGWRAEAVMSDLAEQFDHYEAQAPWQWYLPPEGGESVLPGGVAWERDALGVPVLGDEELRRLFWRHAPKWRIETRDRNDVPGVPARKEGGALHFRPDAVVHTHLDFTHQGGIVRPQLVYVLWFAARPAEGWADIYAGELDGFVWRVTLDDDGEPLIYDTIHPCGCYHQWLLVEGGLEPSSAVDHRAEQFWLLGSVANSDAAPTLMLSAGEHQLVGIDAASGAVGPGVIWYRLEPLDALRGRSYAGGRLYTADGVIDGTERPERLFLWPTGVRSAGAMRQWGHHAVSFVGRRHFDDPYLLDRYFQSPPAFL